jgi:hypothetical protein
MKFDAVKASFNCVLSTLRKLCNGALDILGRHLPRRIVLILAICVEAKLLFQRHSGCGNGLHAAQLRHGGTTTVPYLGVDIGSLLVHRVDNLLPSFDLLRKIDSGNTWYASGLRIPTPVSTTFWVREPKRLTSTFTAIPSEIIKPPAVARWR